MTKKQAVQQFAQQHKAIFLTEIRDNIEGISHWRPSRIKKIMEETPGMRVVGNCVHNLKMR